MKIQVLTDGLTVGGKVWNVGAVIDTDDKELVPIPDHVMEAVKAGDHPHLQKVTKKQAQALEVEQAEKPVPDLPPAGVRPVDGGEIDEPIVRTERESAKGTISAQLVSRKRRRVEHTEARVERVG